jgi:hypothetical protein
MAINRRPRNILKHPETTTDVVWILKPETKTERRLITMSQSARTEPHSWPRPAVLTARDNTAWEAASPRPLLGLSTRARVVRFANTPDSASQLKRKLYRVDPNCGPTLGL